MESLDAKIQGHCDDVTSKIEVAEDSQKLILFNDLDRLKDLSSLLNLNVQFSKGIYGTGLDEELLIKINNDFWNNFDSMQGTNSRICALGNCLPSEDFSEEKMKIDISEIFALVSSFFDYYDHDVSRHYNRISDQGYIYMCDGLNRCYGETFTLRSQGCSYIVLDGSDCDIILASTLAHETIHSYVNSFLYNISYEELVKMNINGLNEVYSHFIEFVFLHYLKEIGYDERIVQYLGNSLNHYLISNLNYFSREFSDFNNLQDINEYMDGETYGYGVLMAIHYFERYLNDCEKTKDEILRMSLDSKDLDKHALLNAYGLNEYELGSPRILTKHFN